MNSKGASSHLFQNEDCHIHNLYAGYCGCCHPDVTRHQSEAVTRGAGEAPSCTGKHHAS